MGAVDPSAPTADAESTVPLERRHVIASVLATLGFGAMGSAQASPDSDDWGRGWGRGRGHGDGRHDIDVEIKTGIVDHDSPGAAEDGTWNTFEVDRQSVAFDEPFESPPVVLIGSTSYTSIGLFRAIDVTEAGFESRWMVYRSTSFAAPDAQWVAVGRSQS